MIDPETVCKNILEIIDKNNSEYKLFSHGPALTYEDLEQARKETGFAGTEGKCLVLKADGRFVVCVTLSRKRIDFDKAKEKLNAKKIRLASKEELKEHFGAEPGCAYPFGFGKEIDTYVDPEVYDQEWFLFSPALPTKTVQIKGSSLKDIFRNLQNKVFETSEFIR